ncbi:MAG: tetratricopeptide repeat protein [Candidatus Heimdallarchaeota archaeon]
MSYETFWDLIYREADLAKAAALVERLPSQDTPKALMFRFLLSTLKDQYQGAIQLASEAIQKARKAGDHIIALEATNNAFYSFLLTNSFKEHTKLAREAEDLLEFVQDADYDQHRAQEAISTFYAQLGIKEAYVGQINKALELGKKALAIASESGSPVCMCYALWVLTLTHQQDKAQASIALEYANKLLSLAQEHKLKLCFVWACHSLISCHRQLGNLDKSLEYANLGIPLAKKIGWKWITDMMIGEVGHQYFARGDYEQALQHFKHACDAAQDRSDHWQMAVHLINMGHVYRAKGELNSALGVFQQLYAGSSAINNRFYQSYASQAIGTIHFDQGAFEDALKMFQESKQLREGFRNKAHLATTLLSLMQLTLELNNLTDAQRYFSQLDEIHGSVPPNKNFQTNYEFAQALLLKASPRMREKAKAQEIFEVIANDPENRHSVITSAMLNLCDLLLYEYKSAEEPQILEEIISLSQRLYSVSQPKNDHRTMVKGLMLQGKLALLEGHLDKAAQLLEEASKIAEMAGLKNLHEQIQQEQEQISREVENWESLLARNASIRERFEQARLAEYVRDALRVMEDELLPNQ